MAFLEYSSSGYMIFLFCIPDIRTDFQIPRGDFIFAMMLAPKVSQIVSEMCMVGLCIYLALHLQTKNAPLHHQTIMCLIFSLGIKQIKVICCEL